MPNRRELLQGALGLPFALGGTSLGSGAAHAQAFPSRTITIVAPFPAGDYRLEIKVTDKPTGKAVTQNVTFTVTG